MAKDEFWEHHLTPSGWQAGSTYIDGAGAKEIEPPSDRVLTLRFWSPQFFSKNSPEGWQEEWRDKDKPELIEELFERYGKTPPKGN